MTDRDGFPDEPPYEVEMLFYLAAQIAGRSAMSHVLAAWMHEHQEAIALWRVSRFAVPVGETATEYLREHWPADAGPVPAEHELTALAITIGRYMIRAARKVEGEQDASN